MMHDLTTHPWLTSAQRVRVLRTGQFGTVTDLNVFGDSFYVRMDTDTAGELPSVYAPDELAAAVGPQLTGCAQRDPQPSDLPRPALHLVR